MQHRPSEHPSVSVESPGGDSQTRLRQSRVPPASAFSGLLESEERYRTLRQNLNDAVLILAGETGLFTEANPRACELFGCSEAALLTSSLESLLAPAAQQDAHRILTELAVAQRTVRTRLQFSRQDGLPFLGDLIAAAFFVAGKRECLVVIRDASQQVRRERDLSEANAKLREAQAQLQQSSQLATLGELAAGVAHEVNNPASFIAVYLSEAREEVERLNASFEALRVKYSENSTALEVLTQLVPAGRPLSELSDMLADSLEGVDRIAATVKELRAFSRVEREEAQVVNVNEIVKTACKLCQTQIRYRARLEQSLQAARPLVASRGRLIQVLTNLLTNAVQAIEEGNPEKNWIRIATEDTEDCVRITVEDTGAGIDAETRAKIFQPFFNTKSRDQGTGLGLSLAANIVRDHLGEISVHSEPNGTTRFEVSLPFNTGLLPIWARLPLAPLRKTRGRGKILIIDDEIHLLRAYQRALGRYHDIELAEGGKLGLERILSKPDLDLVVCDLMMPEVDGVAVYAGVKEHRPELLKRLAFSTGGVFTGRCREFLGSVTNVRLQKPLELAAVDELLARLGVRGSCEQETFELIALSANDK